MSAAASCRTPARLPIVEPVYLSRASGEMLLGRSAMSEGIPVGLPGASINVIVSLDIPEADVARAYRVALAYRRRVLTANDTDGSRIVSLAARRRRRA